MILISLTVVKSPITPRSSLSISIVTLLRTEPTIFTVQFQFCSRIKNGTLHPVRQPVTFVQGLLSETFEFVLITVVMIP